MFQNLLSKLPYSLILLLMLTAAAQFSYADTGGTAKTFTADDDDDRRKGKGKRGRGDKDKDRHSQRDSDRESRRQQNRSDNNSRRQQRESDRESRRQQNRSDDSSRRQQWESDRESRRQQRESDNISRRQQQSSDRNSRRQQRESDRRGDYNQNYRRSNNDRRVISVSPQGFWNQMWNGGGNYRRDERRYRRDQQRYIKQQRKAEKRYQRNAQRYQNSYERQVLPVYGYDNRHDDGFLGSGGGSGWKDLILRSVIANVLGGGGGFDLGNFIPQQRNNYDSPANYGGYQSRTRSTPYYAPADYAYDEQPSYGLSGGSLLSSLPIAEILEQYTGGNEFVSALVGNFISQGYDQGYLAGQNAREDGYRNAVYNDPYAYQNGSCDPYSVSLGQNRQYLSQGHELGYRDALNGGTNYDPMTEGNTDLVSALLNNVLGGI